MGTKAFSDLYDRFVTSQEVGRDIVVVNDTDPGIMTSDHSDSPWVLAALEEAFMRDQYMNPGKVLIIPFSEYGPTLLLYWLCERPKVVRLDGVGFEVTMPYGRLLALYYEEGQLKMKMYYAK